MAKTKVALFGGTFDPIHLGHTTVAAEAGELIGAEKVIFIPAKLSPLKGLCPRASEDDRLAMIDLAIAESKNFDVSDCELKRPAPSYTLETVREFKGEFGSETDIYWLVGADSIGELALWHRIVDLIDECNISAMYRAGCEPPDFAEFEAIWGSERVAKLQRNVIPTPLIDISSTEIKSRVATGQDVTNMLHPAVAGYIRDHGLYQAKAAP